MQKPFKYIVENDKDARWGLTITTVGYEAFRPGDDYPSKEYGGGYAFDPSKGRVLQEYQLCYISEGRGFFESLSYRRCQVEAGTMFLLFPGEWHTYSPDKANGWKQYWIGFKGANMDVRVENGFLKKEDPLFHVGINKDIICLFQQAVNVAIEENAHFQLLLAGIANHLLGLMYCLDRNRRFNTKELLVERMNKARTWMQERLEEQLSIQELACELGMSYSLFRKRFKEYTGLSPSQYLLDIRLQRARELLRTTDLPVKEIAYRLHFEAPDYFSSLFRKKVGISPKRFRE